MSIRPSRLHKGKKSPVPVPSGENKRASGWRCLLVLLSLLGSLAFFVPVLGGILNIANVSAMIGFLLLAALFCFWSRSMRLLRWLWARGWGKLFVLFLGLGTGTLILALGVLFCLVATKLRAVPQKPCPTLLVLGCQVQGSSPSLLLRDRIEAAAEYLAEHPEAVAVLSGGQGSGEQISEAECMYRELIARGIQAQRLYLEAQSRNTLENMRFSKTLMEQQGLKGPVAVVSNDFHIYRAMKMAEDVGIEACALAAKSNYWFCRPTYMLREAMAMIKYWLTS